jgi:hypothetical protein
MGFCSLPILFEFKTRLIHVGACVTASCGDNGAAGVGSSPPAAVRDDTAASGMGGCVCRNILLVSRGCQELCFTDMSQCVSLLLRLFSELVDQATQRHFYVNMATNVSTWDRPTVAALVPAIRSTVPVAPPAVASLAPLSAGWEERVDQSTQRHYYVNIATNESTWKRPIAAAPLARPPAPVASAPSASLAVKPTWDRPNPPLVTSTATPDTTIYSLELYVQYVEIEITERPIRPAMAFRLLDFPSVVIYAPPPPPAGRPLGPPPATLDIFGQPVDIHDPQAFTVHPVVPFNRGKSCLFSLSAASLQALLSKVPLYLMLVDVPEGQDSQSTLLGTTAIDLSEFLHSVRVDVL